MGDGRVFSFAKMYINEIEKIFFLHAPTAAGVVLCVRLLSARQHTPYLYALLLQCDRRYQSACFAMQIFFQVVWCRACFSSLNAVRVIVSVCIWEEDQDDG